jgi:hypothetical protein
MQKQIADLPLFLLPQGIKCNWLQLQMVMQVIRQWAAVNWREEDRKKQGKLVKY